MSGDGMIEPVNTNNRGYYEYTKINTEMGKGMENHAKFALGYDSTEKDSNKKEDKKSVKEKDGVTVEFSSQSQNQQSGIGTNGKTADNAQDAFDMGQTMKQVKGFIGGLLQAIADLFIDFKKALIAFWNSDSKSRENEEENPVDIIESSARELEEGEEFASDVIPQEVEGVRETETSLKNQINTLPELPDRNTEFPPMSQRRVARIHPQDDTEEKMRQAEELFANQKYVKNSDLLTYYDKRGKLVQLSGTDKNRILHGNKNPGRIL